MKVFFISYLLVFSFSAVFVYIYNAPGQFTSFLGGGILMFVNIVLLTWYWHRIFVKKSIALTVGVIVFKYATLLIIIYKIVEFNGTDVKWLVVGLSIFLPSILLSALLFSANKKAS